MEIDVLIGCEESGIVTESFRNMGINAWSCDLLPTSGSLPQFHIQDDVLKIISEHPEIKTGIFFPPCTHLASSGARWFKEKGNKVIEAILFVRKLWDANINKICIENPIGILSSNIKKPDQIIQPWMFGHGETKATCLWLKNLPLLKPTNIVEGREHRIWKMPPSPERSKLRSKTYKNIGIAMAEQWG